MAGLRSEWQAFKKAHPDFEKSKNFKADVGPQLDKYEAALNDMKKQVSALEAQIQNIEKIGVSVIGAFEGYASIAKTLKEKDKSIGKDWMVCLTKVHNFDESVREALDGAAQRFEKDVRGRQFPFSIG